ncbi:MAG: hypothetical protein A2X11_14345 [Bacteroidetes bacterium GWE2_42_24]|nr:MAG: hypothetical protein A2X11_14345 [Bacteroidetes bacterium GWE2_42_24]PKP27199.1 MAG: hypothetical protein CVU06_03065 [Bacteroidetes bacterium HGW-Bacteroidetes-22]
MLAVGLSIFLLWITLQIISVFTHHGEKIEVPDFVGQLIGDASVIADDNGLEIIVMDSVYNPRKEKGVIMIQDPLPASFVKEGRKVYVTIVGQTPEKVKMPNLVDLSVRQAVERVVAARLQVDYIQVVRGEFNNAVIEQFYEGKPVRPGRELDRNSKIVLVVEQAEGATPAVVPDLIGNDIAEAYGAVFSVTLNVGKVVFRDGLDESTSRVYKQDPQPGIQLSAGNQVNLWFRNETK